MCYSASTRPIESSTAACPGSRNCTLGDSTRSHRRYGRWPALSRPCSRSQGSLFAAAESCSTSRRIQKAPQVIDEKAACHRQDDMLIQPIDIFVYAWLVVAAFSAAYVAWDQFRGNPEPAVMKWGFVLVTLYMGPIGLLLYVMADKEPAPGQHEDFIKPLWKQGVGSTVHCVAGDATGIIAAAVAVALIGLPMWVDLIIEYTVGFLFGLLIFQALFMRKMMGGTYRESVAHSFLPELISMNGVRGGMARVMVFLMMGRDMRAMWPGEPLFWMVMSLGVTAGFAIAYPVNVWLVSRGMKHGLMTDRDGSSATGSMIKTPRPAAGTS